MEPINSTKKCNETINSIKKKLNSKISSPFKLEPNTHIVEIHSNGSCSLASSLHMILWKFFTASEIKSNGQVCLTSAIEWKKGAYIYDIMEKQLDPITAIIHGKDIRGAKLCIIFDRVTPQYWLASHYDWGSSLWECWAMTTIQSPIIQLKTSLAKVGLLIIYNWQLQHLTHAYV